MKGIASKYCEKLRELEFPQKDKYTVVHISDPQGFVVMDFVKGNPGQMKQAGIILGGGTIISAMMKTVKDKGLVWKEVVSGEWEKVLKDYATAEENIWYEFEKEITQAYLPNVVQEVAEEFYLKCWEYAKARSEDMGGIEELFEKFSGYLTK